MAAINSKEIQTFISNLANAIEGLDPQNLNSDTLLNEIPQWDSLAVLASMAMMDEEYDINLTGKEIQACATIKDLFLRTQQ